MQSGHAQSEMSGGGRGKVCCGVILSPTNNVSLRGIVDFGPKTHTKDLMFAISKLYQIPWLV